VYSESEEEIMARSSTPDALPEILQFNPRWWWDPVPWWLIKELDRTVLTELATEQLRLQKEVLGAQIKSIDASLAILAKQRG